MAKSFDGTTAPKVEALLLEAVEKYQTHQRQKQQQQQQQQQSTAIETAEKEGTQQQQGSSPTMMVTPNTVSFTNAITAWARCTRRDSPKRAEALLNRMHSLYEEGWEDVRPNKVSYNSVITAWARCKDRRGSAEKGEELLSRMYDFYESERAKLTEGGGADVVAEDIAGDLKPDARSWNAVINLVARSRDPRCAHRAKSLLDEMGRRYDEGDVELMPDALTFGAIINAYANSLEEGASDTAAQLLMHMESLYQLGFDDAKPTTFVYNACMNAFAKDPLILNNATNSGTLSRAQKAEQLLSSMEKRYQEEKDHRVMPDCISYSTVINAYANSQTPQSGTHADDILRRMMHRYLMGDIKCRPNAVAFTAAMKAHSAAINATMSISEGESTAAMMTFSEMSSEVQQQVKASAKRCEDLLQQLCIMYHQSPGNDRSLKPTSTTFDVVERALMRAEDEDGAKMVRLLREEGMIDVK